MELKITGKNIELTDDIERHIERKLAKLSRHLPGIEETRVEVAEEKTKSRRHRFVAQVTVSVKGALLRSKEREANLLDAIDRAAEVMDRQISHFKGKRSNKGKGSSALKGELG